MAEPPTTQTSTEATSSGRDVYVDFIRALSLLVVVTWHWVFTIVIWREDGPHASNPIGFTSGMWLATWLFQVMPLFFYIGGYGHLRAWEKASAAGTSIWSFVWVRIKRLAIPALALLGVWVTLGIVLGVVFDFTWAAQAVTLVVSPLWFIAVYLMLVLLLPVALWLHRRFDITVLVLLGGCAMLIDIGRFDRGWDELGLVNMILVWGFCHQMGFFYDRIVAAHRKMDINLMLVGLFALMGLVGSGLYPGSMVGVPGEKTSNMGPPTVCILALVLFQAGVVEVLRPWFSEKLTLPPLGAGERGDQPVLDALVLVPHHGHGSVASSRIRPARRGERETRTRSRVVAHPTAVVHRPTPVHVAGDLVVRTPVDETGRDIGSHTDARRLTGPADTARSTPP